MDQGSPKPIPQACAIPYRVRAGSVEVCLVTSRRKGRWVFPKGLVETGDSETETALKEAREEAGLRGQISGRTIGRYERQKLGVRFSVACYLMQVDYQQREWRESSIRQREWVSLAEARTRIGPRCQREILVIAAKFLRRYASRAG